MRRSGLLCVMLALFLLAGCGPKGRRVMTDREGREYSRVLEGFNPASIPDPEEFIEVDDIPEPAYEQAPEYPPEAQEKGITGSVTVQAFVGDDGRIKKVQITKCKPRNIGFEQAALDAAFKNRYKPAKNKGKAVGVWIAYKVNFTLE